MKANEQDQESTPSSRRPASSAPASNAVSRIPAEQLKRLIELRHQDPHSILGAHPTDRGVIVRDYRPDAVRVLLLSDGEATREMVERPEPGLFEILLADRHQVFPYRIEVHYPGGA